MSSLLEQAIIDAKTVRDNAKKQAESLILEQYHEEIKKTMDSLLMEEEELGLSEPDEIDEKEKEFSDSLPLASQDKEADPENGKEEGEEVEINFDQLQQLSDEEAEVLDQQEDLLDVEGSENNEEGEENEEGLEGSEEPPVDSPEEQNLQESDEIDIPDELFEEMLEKLKLEYEMHPSGFAINDTIPERDEAIDISVAQALHDDEIRKKNEELKNALNEIKSLKEQNNLIKGSLQETKESLNNIQDLSKKLLEKMNEMAITNAKLFYQNQTLSNISLNERQKQKLVENIVKTKTSDEAKTTYFAGLNVLANIETEQNKQTLNEMLEGNVSYIQKGNANKTMNENSNMRILKERMQRIAGIQKK